MDGGVECRKVAKLRLKATITALHNISHDYPIHVHSFCEFIPISLSLQPFRSFHLSNSLINLPVKLCREVSYMSLRGVGTVPPGSPQNTQ